MKTKTKPEQNAVRSVEKKYFEFVKLLVLYLFSNFRKKKQNKIQTQTVRQNNMLLTLLHSIQGGSDRIRRLDCSLRWCKYNFLYSPHRKCQANTLHCNFRPDSRLGTLGRRIDLPCSSRRIHKRSVPRTYHIYRPGRIEVRKNSLCSYNRRSIRFPKPNG